MPDGTRFSASDREMGTLYFAFVVELITHLQQMFSLCQIIFTNGKTIWIHPVHIPVVFSISIIPMA